MFSMGKVLLGFVIGAAFLFAPSVWAVLRGNINRGQVIKYQLALFVLDIVCAAVLGLFVVVLGDAGALVTVIGGLWGLFTFVLWCYVAYHALVDREMTLFSRFGINL